jgi:LysR family transcriptional regulator, transcriptional activator for dmlA
MDWLTNLKSFIDVVDHQSFTQAAEKRYSSPAVLSRRVTWLEDRLGVVLMQRTTRSLQLTEEGKLFYNRGKQWLAHLNEITLHLQNQQKILQGPLHITMPYSFSETALVSKLIADFATQNPQIELTLDFSNQTHDLIENNIDIALRAVPYYGANYISTKIATLKLGVYGSPKYFIKHAAPKILSDLTKHHCLLHQQMGYNEWEFKDAKKILVAGNIKSNATAALIEFARKGLGLVRTLDCYVTKDVNAKTLQPILKTHWPELPLYLVHKDLTTAPLRVKAFVEFIKKFSLTEYLRL